MSSSNANTCHWLVDVRNEWQGEKIDDAASKALACVSAAEAERARKFIFLKDAKLSLASSLLKRLFACKLVSVPWHDAQFGRAENPKHGKPCLVLPSKLSTASSNLTEEPPIIDFNVTHQAGLVALAGCYARHGHSIRNVGIDVVCVNERAEFDDVLKKNDFNYWADIHAEVFSAADVASMKAPIITDNEVDLFQMLRRFYAFWALKEAYVKLQGEALLADWLKDVVFQNVTVPAATAQPLSTKWGETVEDIEVWMYGKKKANVLVFLQAFEDKYMIATMYLLDSPENRQGLLSPMYDILDVEQDILPWAV